MTLSIGSLFSGIGGLELGLDWGLGAAETRWQVEYEEHARLILAQHWPEAARHKDVRHVGATSLEPVDLICGGFPCQPHSVAGKRRSSDDDRDLWGEFARLVGELGPRWVVAENVPGLLSSSDPAFSRDHPGGFFGRVLRDLAALGFDAEWHSFPAAAVGAHHRRDRVFIVAHAAQLLSHVGGHHTRGDSEGARPLPESGDRRGAADLADWTGGSWEQPCPLTTSGAESGLRGVSDGLSARVERLARLGNAVVPQQAAVIGRAIKEAEAHLGAFGVMPEQIVQHRHLVAS